MADFEGHPYGSPTCKIGHARGLYFGLTGFYPTRLRALAMEAAYADDSLPGQVDAFDRALHEMSLTLRDSLSDSADRAGWGAGPWVIAEAILFGPTAGTLRLSYRRLSLVRSGDETQWNARIDKMECPGPDCPDGKAVLILGAHDLVRPYLDFRPSYWLDDDDPVRRIMQVMDLAVKTAPQLVAPPIDVIEITPTDARWVRRKPECHRLHPGEHEPGLEPATAVSPEKAADR